MIRAAAVAFAAEQLEAVTLPEFPHPRIEIDPAVMGGKPVIRDTRVTVQQVLRECARGANAAEVADQYPRVNPEDVAAALAFAAD